MDSLIKEANQYIRDDNFEKLFDLWQEYRASVIRHNRLNNPEIFSTDSAKIKETERVLLEPYLFIKLFSNACLHNRLEIAKWLFELYKEYDDIMKIGVKSIFNYCRTITRGKEKYKDLHRWLIEVTV